MRQVGLELSSDECVAGGCDGERGVRTLAKLAERRGGGRTPEADAVAGAG